MCGWRLSVPPWETDSFLAQGLQPAFLLLSQTRSCHFIFYFFSSFVVFKPFPRTGAASFLLFSLKIALVFRLRARACWLSRGGILLCQEGTIRGEQGISLLQGCSLYLERHRIKTLASKHGEQQQTWRCLWVILAFKCTVCKMTCSESRSWESLIVWNADTNLRCQMKCFRGPLSLLQMYIWEGAHAQHLERGRPLKNNLKCCRQSSCFLIFKADKSEFFPAGGAFW